MSRRWSLFSRDEPPKEENAVPNSIGPRQAEILRRLSMPRTHDAAPPEGTVLPPINAPAEPTPSPPAAAAQPLGSVAPLASTSPPVETSEKSAMRKWRSALGSMRQAAQDEQRQARNREFITTNLGSRTALALQQLSSATDPTNGDLQARKDLDKFEIRLTSSKPRLRRSSMGDVPESIAAFQRGSLTGGGNGGAPTQSSRGVSASADDAGFPKIKPRRASAVPAMAGGALLDRAESSMARPWKMLAGAIVRDNPAHARYQKKPPHTLLQSLPSRNAHHIEQNREYIQHAMGSKSTNVLSALQAKADASIDHRNPEVDDFQQRSQASREGMSSSLGIMPRVSRAENARGLEPLEHPKSPNTN